MKIVKGGKNKYIYIYIYIPGTYIPGIHEGPSCVQYVYCRQRWLTFLLLFGFPPTAVLHLVQQYVLYRKEQRALKSRRGGCDRFCFRAIPVSIVNILTLFQTTVRVLKSNIINIVVFSKGSPSTRYVLL